MKHIAEQYEIDFAKLEAERPLFERWEANRAADAHNWTMEAMAMVWFLGRSDWEEWRNLPGYTRRKVLEFYEHEQQDAAATGRRTITPANKIFAPWDKKSYQQEMEYARRIAADLFADWSVGRPSSWRTCDPILATRVSAILGRKVEAVTREELEAWE